MPNTIKIHQPRPTSWTLRGTQMLDTRRLILVNQCCVLLGTKMLDSSTNQNVCVAGSNPQKTKKDFCIRWDRTHDL